MQIYNLIVKSTISYGAETWEFDKNFESKLMSMKMDFLKRLARCYEKKILRIRFQIT